MSDDRNTGVSLTTLPLWGKILLSLCAGALIPLSFAPFDWWPLGFVAIALFYLCLQQSSSGEAFKLGFALGLGLFGIGASWIFVSIYYYGEVAPIFAVLITLGFVVFMALYNAVHCWLWQRYCSQWQAGIGFAATWVLCEIFRAWFLTGFPWLFLGYAHVTSPLSGVAPVFGVYGASLLVAVGGVWLAQLLSTAVAAPRSQALRQLSLRYESYALTALLLLAFASTQHDWTQRTAHEPVSVALVQGNVPQELKFNDIQQGLDDYARLTSPLWDTQIVLWPETAIPLIHQKHPELIEQLAKQAELHNTAFVTGIFYQSERGLHNSIITAGNAKGMWFKQKLVPFGEYVPLESLLADMLGMFNLPNTSLTAGPAEQALLDVAGVKVAPYICYEVVYPDFARRYGKDADLLLTISNDTWFGASLGPLQHLQMAAMRARELGRYMLRATNNGISALIDHEGHVVAETQQFRAETLRGNVYVREGHTPFSRWGSWPVWLFCIAVLAMNVSIRQRRSTTTPRS